MGLIPEFIRSLTPQYYKGKTDEAFAELKYQELLVILWLQNEPELAGIFFDYGCPGK